MALIVFGNYDRAKPRREGKGKSVITFPENYCVVDIETTGLSPDWDEIIEIGAIRYCNGEEIDRFQSLLQPQKCYDGEYVSAYITELTGITNEMLSCAPSAEQVLPLFDSFLKTDLIVGYNVGFDVNFLFDAYLKYLNKPLINDYIDVMRLSRKLYPDLPHHRLRDMVKILGVQNVEAHRALADVVATAQCYNILRVEAIKEYGTEEGAMEAFKRRYTEKQGIRAGDSIGDDTKNDPESPLYKKYCVFTGKLERLSRQQAMQIVADLGGINEDGVTKNTNYLILGNNDYCKTIKEGKSNKQKKAENYKLKGQDIEILPEAVFYDMLTENLEE